jgi:hypothetical protein
MPHGEDDGLFYDAEEDAAAPDLPPQRWVWATRLGVAAAVIVAVVLVASVARRRDGADEAPPPWMTAAAPDASGPHPHEWAPPNARIVHYIDLTRPPTPHQQQRLISRNKPVTASVRGNLGEASVITNGKRDDWLKDRWQAAKNMQGAPIPGPHWLLVELEQRCVVERIDVEFESAYARDYALKGRTRDGGWVTLAVGVSAVESRPAKQRVLHRLASQAMAPVDQVKLEIARPGTQWGTSVWELDVFGMCAG